MTESTPVRLHARDSGGDGHPILLLHGWSCTHTVWDEFWNAAPPGVRLIAPDLRGWGDSPMPATSYSFGEHALDLEALCEVHGLGPATVIGSSMGGAIALRFAHDRPERVGRLILIGTGARVDPQAGVLRRHPDIFDSGLDAESLRGAIRGWLPRTAAARIEDLLAAALRTPGPLRGRILAAHHATDATPLLGSIRAPSLVLWGEQDRQRTLADARALRDGIPTADLRAIPGTGHLPFVEAPREVWRAL